MALTAVPTLCAINDSHGQWFPAEPDRHYEQYLRDWQGTPPPGADVPSGAALDYARERIQVAGGFMERLPLACLAGGLVDYAETWHYEQESGCGSYGLIDPQQPLFGWRGFGLHRAQAPFYSADMLAFVETHGAPHILCVWGLGVDERVLEACRESFKVYYSICAEPLRVPHHVARHFDLILAGDRKQQTKVREDLPGAPCELLTLGPEFADADTFRPLGVEKRYDLVYVACAQAYKRHDLLFEAMAALRGFRPVSCLCVCGYGDLVDSLKKMAAEMGCAVDFVGPPSISFAEVNACINQARIGVVAGVEDGCPGVITEYMLAGLPVLMNAEIRCGSRFLTPETGWLAHARDFPLAIQMALDAYGELDPRSYAIEHWGWKASVRRFEAMLHDHGFRRRSGGVEASGREFSSL